MDGSGRTTAVGELTVVGECRKNRSSGLTHSCLKSSCSMFLTCPCHLSLLTSRESNCFSEDGCEHKMLTGERSANMEQCCYSTGRAMWLLSGLNEIMHEYHLAHSDCLLKNKCLPCGDDLCQESEETLPTTVCSYRALDRIREGGELRVLLY